jgi:hypothetical protein
VDEAQHLSVVRGMLAIVLKYLPLLQVATVIVASGILTVGLTRELYENEKYTIRPPGLGPVEVTRLKYTTTQAAVARENFRLLVGMIYLLLVTLLACLFAFVALETTYETVGYWRGGREAGASCFDNNFYRFLLCEIATVAHDAAEQTKRAGELTFPMGILMLYLLLFGGVLILGLGMAVRTVVDIRANHK